MPKRKAQSWPREVLEDPDVLSLDEEGRYILCKVCHLHYAVHGGKKPKPVVMNSNFRTRAWEVHKERTNSHRNKKKQEQKRREQQQLQQQQQQALALQNPLASTHSSSVQSSHPQMRQDQPQSSRHEAPRNTQTSTPSMSHVSQSQSQLMGNSSNETSGNYLRPNFSQGSDTRGVSGGDVFEPKAATRPLQTSAYDSSNAMNQEEKVTTPNNSSYYSPSQRSHSVTATPLIPSLRSQQEKNFQNVPSVTATASASGRRSTPILQPIADANYHAMEQNENDRHPQLPRPNLNGYSSNENHLGHYRDQEENEDGPQQRNTIQALLRWRHMNDDVTHALNPRGNTERQYNVDPSYPTRKDLYKSSPDEGMGNHNASGIASRLNSLDHEGRQKQSSSDSYPRYWGTLRDIYGKNSGNDKNIDSLPVTDNSKEQLEADSTTPEDSGSSNGTQKKALVLHDQALTNAVDRLTSVLSRHLSNAEDRSMYSKSSEVLQDLTSVVARMAQSQESAMSRLIELQEQNTMLVRNLLEMQNKADKQSST